jgi:catechol 2,3-dioxygenase-like lactoylglutathione lyase family enzyme
VQGISHLVIEVTDTERAAQFYGDTLGVGVDALENWPQADERALALPSGQMLVLKSGAAGKPQDDSGVHQAYRCTPEARTAIEEKLTKAGITVHRYHEDRPAEMEDPFYFTDPDGNRIQLVTAPGEARGVWGIDHAAVQASDMEWEEEFFIDRLGFPVDHRVGWNTEDFVRAQAWAEGRDDMAPGTRRKDNRYRDNPGAEPGSTREVARANVQIFLGLGSAALGIFLATRHHQEPAPELACGTPRTGLATDQAGMEAMAAALGAGGVTVEGPVVHDPGAVIAQSLYFRDPCGNFFEICVPTNGAG